MVGDTTAIETSDGWLYLALLLDLGSRAIVGWAFSDHNDTDLVAAAFKMSMLCGFKRGFIHHTDRGSTYASGDYRAMVEAAGGIRSMSRKANCWDNAVAESVFRTIKEELFGDQPPTTMAETRAEVFAYVAGYYNRDRLHSSLDYVTPNEFERMHFNNNQEA